MNTAEHETNPDIVEAYEVIRVGRERIDAIDMGIIELIAERLRVAQIMGEAKRTIGLPMVSVSRETQVMQGAMDRGDELGVPKEVCANVMRPVIIASKRAQVSPLVMEAAPLEADGQ